MLRLKANEVAQVDSEFLWLEKDPHIKFSVVLRVVPYRRVAEELLHWTWLRLAELREVSQT